MVMENIKRRRFRKALFDAALSVTNMKRQNKQVGLIGCGRIARVHAEAIQHVEDLHLSAVCDVVEEKVDHFAQTYNARKVTSYADLLACDDIDLVTIATPNGTHFEIARASFQAKKHVLIEKPVTIRNCDAEELISMAEAKGVHFFAVKQVRYNPAIRVVKSAIEAGHLGRIYNASLVVRWTRPQAYFDQVDWRGTRDLDGGTLLNQGIHYIDVMQWLVGDVDAVFGRTDCFCHDIELEDTAFGLIHFRSGALGSVEFTVNTYPHNLECSLTILGETGSIKLGGSAMNQIETWEVRDMSKPVVPEGFPPYVYEEGLYQGSCPNHLFVYQDIVKVFQGVQTAIVDGSEALRSMRIVNGLYESAGSGEEVRL